MAETRTEHEIDADSAERSEVAVAGSSAQAAAASNDDKDANEESRADETDEAEDREAVSTNAPSSVVALSVDENVNDRDDDSAIADTSLYTTATSVRSSVYQYVEENGRTYHRYKEGKYHLPNDEREQDRLDLQHHLFLLTLDGELYNAPIKDLPGGVHNVLDLATGTGIWAIDFSMQFPSANVIGVDLSPIQPEWTPPNCSWEVDDVEDPWLYSHKFDYIRQFHLFVYAFERVRTLRQGLLTSNRDGRALATCFKSHLPVISSAFDALRSGGYLELQDCVVPFSCLDDSIEGTSLKRWVDLMMEATARIGKDWTKVRHYKSFLEQVGFVDVVERKYEWPLGTWAKGQRNKQLGAWYREDMLNGLQGFSMAMLTRAMGMTPEEVELLLVGVRDDMKSNRIHVYVSVRVVYGRKP